uniref:DUF4376 domain-containing protein n=1 Tax=Desulfovibrio sp. U5L TaxID=596152 RepID=I2Q2M3_9BACT
MQIVNHQLQIEDIVIDLPRLAVAAQVHAWAVPAAYRDNGHFVSVQVAGQPMEIPACDGRDAQYLGALALEADAGAALAAAKAGAAARIDAQAEVLCNQVVTPGSAQMARYQRKEAIARSYLAALTAGALPADEAARAEAYPAVFGEVGITADTPEAVARTIVAMADAWWAYGDALEKVRLAGKRDVGAAADPAGVAAAEAAVAWPDPPAA